MTTHVTYAILSRRYKANSRGETMQLEGANEADVREEIASPFLAALGYARGTPNGIERELSLVYDRVSLGRKKASDPKLRGRADYVLIVTGVARWVLEIKSPSEDISIDVVEQAISYARHPEVSGVYAAILNGKRLVIFGVLQASNEAPLLDLEVKSPVDLASKVQSLVSPAAIRRDCATKVVDLGAPLAEGFRSSAVIIGGTIRYLDCVWECSIQIPPQVAGPLNETCTKIKGLISNISGGRIWRDENSRIKAKLEWSVPHDEILKFIRDKNLEDAEYISLSQEISNDPMRPTVFDVIGAVKFEQGESVFNVLKWQSTVMGMPGFLTYQGQATGYLKSDTFGGNFTADYVINTPSFPGLEFIFRMTGAFEVKVDSR